MFGRSHEKKFFDKTHTKQVSLFSSSVASQSTVGSSTSDKQRLKSLDSRLAQNRQLYSQQQHSSQPPVDRSFLNKSQFKTNLTTSALGERLTPREHLDRSITIGSFLFYLPQEQLQPLLPNDEDTQIDSSTATKGVLQAKKQQLSMQVFVRVRPLNSKEITGANAARSVVRVSSDASRVFINPNESQQAQSLSAYRSSSSAAPQSADKVFEMNGAFNEESTNEQIFSRVMKADIQSSLFDGFHCTCFVYGMTGAGKTFTMFGDIMNYMTMNQQVPGIIMLALREIISQAGLQDTGYATPQDTQESHPTFEVKASYLEIYNEQIHDLLTESSSSDNLMVVEDPQRGVFVPGLTEIRITNESHITECIRIGNTRRQMASTTQNEFSSRSHAIIAFTIEKTLPSTKPNEKQVRFTSKLSLVDLAGSERASITENRGVRLQEGANINRSLLALGNCINILADSSKSGAFVPYRDSKLTRLLKDSLGGNTKTYMIACISPAAASYEETLNTLKYAQRARNIKKTVTQNLSSSFAPTIRENPAQQQQYQQTIETMKREIDSLKAQLASQPQQSMLPLSSLKIIEESFFTTPRDLRDLQQSQDFEMLPPFTSPVENNQQPHLQESFSSSGVSVQISCVSSAGSVVHFKRSPSHSSLVKQADIAKVRAEEEIRQISSKILKNLEENWEITQSMNDLTSLKLSNEAIMKEKTDRLKALRSNLIQWPHESEINNINLQISQLSETMANNQTILDNMQGALQRNLNVKTELQQAMIQALSCSSDQIVKDISQTCEVLQIEKVGLENANYEMRQQQMQIENEFALQLDHIKSMEKQINAMQTQLDEKNMIINSNQQLIQTLSGGAVSPSLLASASTLSKQHLSFSKPTNTSSPTLVNNTVSNKPTTNSMVRLTPHVTVSPWMNASQQYHRPSTTGNGQNETMASSQLKQNSIHQLHQPQKQKLNMQNMMMHSTSGSFVNTNKINNNQNNANNNNGIRSTSTQNTNSTNNTSSISSAAIMTTITSATPTTNIYNQAVNYNNNNNNYDNNNNNNNAVNTNNSNTFKLAIEKSGYFDFKGKQTLPKMPMKPSYTRNHTANPTSPSIKTNQAPGLAVNLKPASATPMTTSTDKRSTHAHRPSAPFSSQQATPPISFPSNSQSNPLISKQHAHYKTFSSPITTATSSILLQPSSHTRTTMTSTIHSYRDKPQQTFKPNTTNYPKSSESKEFMNLFKQPTNSIPSSAAASSSKPLEHFDQKTTPAFYPAAFQAKPANQLLAGTSPTAVVAPASPVTNMVTVNTEEDELPNEDINQLCNSVFNPNLLLQQPKPLFASTIGEVSPNNNSPSQNKHLPQLNPVLTASSFHVKQAQTMNNYSSVPTSGGNQQQQQQQQAVISPQYLSNQQIKEQSPISNTQLQATLPSQQISSFQDNQLASNYGSFGTKQLGHSMLNQIKQTSILPSNLQHRKTDSSDAMLRRYQTNFNIPTTTIHSIDLNHSRVNSQGGNTPNSAIPRMASPLNQRNPLLQAIIPSSRGKSFGSENNEKYSKQQHTTNNIQSISPPKRIVNIDTIKLSKEDRSQIDSQAPVAANRISSPNRMTTTNFNLNPIPVYTNLSTNLSQANNPTSIYRNL